MRICHKRRHERRRGTRFERAFGEFIYLYQFQIILILEREYVAGFWPLDPHPPGSQLENMYRKILKTEQESNKTKDASQTVVSNGASASSAMAIKG